MGSTTGRLGRALNACQSGPVTTPDYLPADVEEVLTDAELAEIAAAARRHDDALAYSRAWELHVEKIDDDRSLPWEDRTVWTEHDLVAAMFIRDFVEDALGLLRPELAAKVMPWVERTDDRFRSYTAEDSGERVAKVAQIDTAGRGWWWFRVPTSGPIVQDLANY